MKAIHRTISKTDLNLGNEIQIDVTIPALTGNYEYIPQSVLYINSNIANQIGVIYLNNDLEIIERAANPTYYDFVPLDTGRSTGSLPSSIKYIIFKILSGSASSDLEIYLTNYLQDY